MTDPKAPRQEKALPCDPAPLSGCAVNALPRLPSTFLLQIDAPRFCAGVIIVAGVVADADTVLRYMLRWPEHRVRDYCHRKHWRCFSLPFVADPPPS